MLAIHPFIPPFRLRLLLKIGKKCLSSEANNTKMSNKTLSFRQIFNLNFGFFGVQIAYALQSANISRIFATLGADPHQLSFFWILPPLMGMIVQPLIGKWSDKTWCRLGRRKPYLLVGAIIAVLVMLLLPNAGSLNLSKAYAFLGLNSAMWFGLFSLIFLDTSINVAMQPFKMMVGDMVSEEQKAQAYSTQSFLCNAGSLFGYLFPIFFTWIGISNTAPEGVVPDSVIWSFYCGAAILILCVLYTCLNVKEMNPKEYAEFHGIEEKADKKEDNPGFIKLLVKAPKTFWTVSLVQFFCWAAFLFLWTYTNGAIADTCWGTSDVKSADYQAAGNWVGVLFAVEAIGAMLWAIAIPKFKTLRGAYVTSLILGAAGFASVFFIHNQYVLFLSFMLIGVCWGAVLSIPFTFVTNALSGNHIGTYLGLFNCAICLPQIVAAATGGGILKLIGGSQAAMFLVAAVLLLCGALAVGLIEERKNN